MEQERNKKFYEKEGLLRDTWTLKKNSPGYYQEMVRYERIADKVGSLGCAVDFGCGDGFLSNLLAKKGLDVFSVDLALSRLKKTKAACTHDSFVITDIEKVGFKSNNFDYLVCSEVLEHIPNYPIVIREMFRVLKPGAKAVITVPYKEKLKTYVCPHCHESFHPDDHLHRFDKGNLAETFSKAGFKIKSQKSFRHKLLVQLQYHLKFRYGFLLRNVDKLFSAINPEFTWYLMIEAEKPK
jgi:SAM-dependent methyltransferase